jgi:hypothetical protein
VPGDVAVAVPRLLSAVWSVLAQAIRQAVEIHSGCRQRFATTANKEAFRGGRYSLDGGYWCRPAWVSSPKWRRVGFFSPSGRGRSPVGTKTITMYVSDLDQSEIPAGKVYQLSIRHPDGATQQLDISEKNYRALKLQHVGKTLKKRGRKPGSTTKATKATKAASTPSTRRRRQTTKRPATA